MWTSITCKHSKPKSGFVGQPTGPRPVRLAMVKIQCTGPWGWSSSIHWQSRGCTLLVYDQGVRTVVGQVRIKLRYLHYPAYIYRRDLAWGVRVLAYIYGKVKKLGLFVGFRVDVSCYYHVNSRRAVCFGWRQVNNGGSEQCIVTWPLICLFSGMRVDGCQLVKF